MAQIQRTVGRYDVLEVIGRGGSATVYLAHQRDLRRHVALKELAPQHVDDPNFAERFVEESRVAGAMSHPSIVTVHEFFEQDGLPHIAMEYLPRGSLRAYVGRLGVAQICGVLESVLAGLSQGERQGVVHRDLKPENLLVAADGRVKIADFGVARAINAAAPRGFVTATGTTIGTPAYMSPEQALGDELTPVTDLYSLGIVAWELLTGQVPFEQTDTPVSVLYRHVHEPVPSVRTLDPDIDERLASWLGGLLAKRPQDRFRGADAAWDALEDIVIDLLGPRWRREARLPTETPEPQARPLTPPPFERGQGGSENRSVLAGATVGGMGSPGAPAGRTTILRPGRRHRVTLEPAPAQPAARGWSRQATALVALGVALAVAVGVVVGLGTRSTAPPSRPSAAARGAALDARVLGVLESLATLRRAELAKLSAAHTPAEQGQAAGAIAAAYSAASGRVSALAGSPADLRSALAGLVAGYRALAAAAHSRSATRYAQVRTRITSAEAELRTVTKRL